MFNNILRSGIKSNLILIFLNITAYCLRVFFFLWEDSLVSKGKESFLIPMHIKVSGVWENHFFLSTPSFDFSVLILFIVCWYKHLFCMYTLEGYGRFLSLSLSTAFENSKYSACRKWELSIVTLRILRFGLAGNLFDDLMLKKKMHVERFLKNTMKHMLMKNESL